jgi:hypothetical protein
MGMNHLKNEVTVGYLNNYAVTSEESRFMKIKFVTLQKEC